MAMCAAIALISAAVLNACDGEIEPVVTPELDGSGDASSEATGPTIGDGGGAGDVVVVEDGSKPIPPGLVCSVDAHCNTGGTCFEGICVCADPYRIQPDGRCGAFPEPGCGDQVDAGATCRSPTGMCNPGELYGTGEANFSCGDFAPAACCFTGCKGPAAPFHCCRPDPVGAIDQICSQGWKTCPHGWRAVADAAACN